HGRARRLLLLADPDRPAEPRSAPLRRRLRTDRLREDGGGMRGGRCPRRERAGAGRRRRRQPRRRRAAGHRGADRRRGLPRDHLMTIASDALLAETLDSVSGEKLWAHIEELARWTKHAGSPEELKSLAYVASELHSYGYRTELIHHDAYISLPGPARVEAL